jgi:hypothetical protein
MLRREYLLLLSRIEAEDSCFVASVLVDIGCRFFASLTGIAGVAFVVLAFSYLYDSAAATPSVWRIVLVPELVRW